MKKKFIVPMLAVLVAIGFAFAGTATAKVAPNRGNTLKQSFTDTNDPYRCTYVYPGGWRCEYSAYNSYCWPNQVCNLHCCGSCR